MPSLNMAGINRTYKGESLHIIALRQAFMNGAVFDSADEAQYVSRLTRKDACFIQDVINLSWAPESIIDTQSKILLHEHRKAASLLALQLVIPPKYLYSVMCNGEMLTPDIPIEWILQNFDLELYAALYSCGKLTPQYKGILTPTFMAKFFKLYGFGDVMRQLGHVETAPGEWQNVIELETAGVL